ncbi:hypothetical protein M0R45_000294 [Rubus argutus]|uniref:Uncharacterized protein n=1 Tax=Rubus argutus TaxID=59490 RepID=A0AAW1VQM6_RUBAR
MPSPMVLNLPRYTKGRKYENGLLRQADAVEHKGLNYNGISFSVADFIGFGITYCRRRYIVAYLIFCLNEKKVTFDTYQWENDGYLIASEGLKHRVFETSLADLQGDEEYAYRKMRLRAEDVQGRTVLTNFWGINFTTDKLRSLVCKWQTLIEAHVDVKTPYLYTLRMFCIGFTKRCRNQVKRTCYGQSSQIRQVAQKQPVLVLLGLPHFRC